MFVRSVIRRCEWWARIGSTVASVNGISRDRLAEGRVLLPAVNDLLRILGVVLSRGRASGFVRIRAFDRSAPCGSLGGIREGSVSRILSRSLTVGFSGIVRAVGLGKGSDASIW